MLPTLKKGVKSDAVRLFKALVRYENTSSMFDAGFEAFIKGWQAEKDLKTDGIIGRLSWGALLKDALGLEEEQSNTTVLLSPSISSSTMPAGRERSTPATATRNKPSKLRAAGPQPWRTSSRR